MTNYDITYMFIFSCDSKFAQLLQDNIFVM